MTPRLIVHGVVRLIDFLKEVFGAEEIYRMSRPDGTVVHAEVRIGDPIVMLGESSDEWKPMPGALHLYVEDADATYARALRAGAISLREPADQFYGDRTAGVQDPSGNHWWISTHVEDVSPEEATRRHAALAHQAPASP